MMRPHFSTEKYHSPTRLYGQQVCPLNSDIPVFVCYTCFFTTHKSPFIFLPLSLYFLSHHVILFLVCMSIPLHLSCFCLCLQYFLSHLPAQQVKAQFKQLQFHQSMLFVAELAYMMSRIALHFVLLALLWTIDVNRWQKRPSCRLLLSNENMTCP